MIYFKGTPVLRTDRLNLRKLCMDDTQRAFDQWLSDERISDHRVSPAHKTIAETHKRMEKTVDGYVSKEFCHWGIELKDGNDLIGEIDLYDFDSSTGNCEVSYSIGYDWWNKGYGTEALKAVVEFAFIHMNVHKLSAAHNTDNPASGRIMGKAGMKQEGVIRHMIRNAKDQYKDCAVYGLLREEYLLQRGGNV
ncbi:GNAT family N-acetyltransferase [Rossellomorea vietnamensis]|jgi:[ribosomal protein S5]-alanine N-acetyltransferase|uniref:GNAT family N-acetyltransferase n=1 Tax=Rossellomorea vietnamensis TaxID=218284 RepID=A0A6I6UC26_9BACI|nr:GNAT family N-acetyltransferase [Rossellomorea vietnamensis]QHE60275.1 GNAT family N-acetyltransferase [Rossellomorea vietnamensis]